jgi:hypothetical protein
VNFSYELRRLHHWWRKKLNAGPIVDAHDHCTNNRVELEASKVVGCFCCCKTYSPSEINEWIDEGTTAMCSKCGIDSVIGNASGFPVEDKAFLRKMNGLWF